MYTKICDLLDILIKMSGEKFDINEMAREINDLEKSIPEIEDEIKQLKETMTDDKYFDASSEIIDRNIELSLKKKINYLQNEIKKLKSKQSKISEEKALDEDGYEYLHKSIEDCQKFIDELKKTNKEEVTTGINKLIELENDRYEKLVKELNDKLNKKEQTDSNDNEINEKITSLEEKLKVEETRLDEVTKSLQTKSSYINEEAKEEDLNKLNRLNDNLQKLMNRKNEILSCITYQCEVIKDNLLNTDNREMLLEDVRKITNRLNELPYLSVEDETLLKEEINQLNSQRDELTAVIENKKYNLKNSKPFELRYEYLTKKIESATSLKTEYEKLLNLLTHEQIDSAIDNLLKLKEERKSLENGFISGNNSDNQKRIIDTLIGNYEKDLSSILNKSEQLKMDIAKQNEEIENANKEVESLSKDKREQFEIENKTEKEHDKKMLEDTLNSINYINNRLLIKITPNQVLDQIEMLLFENKGNEPTGAKTAIIKNYSGNNEFTFEKVESEAPSKVEPEEMIISPDNFVHIDKSEKNDYSFSPIDNTGFVSFDEAYDSTK